MVTVDELCEVMADRGKPIPPATLRYHCRDPRGSLYGKAFLRGRTWFIPAEDADRFAAVYEPYGTLRKRSARETPSPGRCL